MELFIVVLILLIFFTLSQKNKFNNPKLQTGDRSNPFYCDTKKENDQIKSTKKVYLATENEKKLFYCLQKVLKQRYYVHCQTSLIALSEPEESKQLAWSKRVDFVITEKDTKIVAVIELDDLSHNKEDRVQRDKYVNKLLEEKHPLIRIQSSKFYEPKYVASRLEEAGVKIL